MKIRDNETREVFEYGTNIHHALIISANGGYLTFENLQNGDGSLKSGDGGYSFVLDDGKTPEESTSPDAVNGANYANIGGFHGDTTKNNGWIPVEERLPEKYGKYLVTVLPPAGRLWIKVFIAHFSDLMGIIKKTYLLYGKCREK